MTDQALAKLLRQALYAAVASTATACGGTSEPTTAQVGTPPADAGSMACDGVSADADGCSPPPASTCVGADGRPLPPGTVCLVGRRPQGLRSNVDRAFDGGVGQWFAHMAELEAASVEAFRVMRVELVHHGAPTHLRAQAIRAERDEVRHARIARRLARRFGAERRSLPFSDHPVRSLESIALENVVEGCVRETFGALIARWQSRSALDPDVARIMRRIADDETRHAALAWRVGLWIEPRMAEASRVEARRAMTDAVRVLREGLREPSPELRRIAGLPRVAESRAMLAALQDLVWRQRLRAA